MSQSANKQSDAYVRAYVGARNRPFGLRVTQSTNLTARHYPKFDVVLTVHRQPSAPHHTDNLKTKHQIQQAATTCIILSSS